MKRIVVVFFLSLYLFMDESIASDTKNGNLETHYLKIARDSLIGEVNFYLYYNSILRDSLTIKRVDFSFDSLSKVNDSLWHYMYSSRDKAFKHFDYQEQFLLEILNDKIHISYVGIYKFSNPKRPNETTGFFWGSEYRLKVFDSLRISVNYISYEEDLDAKGSSYETNESVINLSYDISQKIYYNKIDTLVGEYSFEPNKPKGYKFRDDEIKKIYFNNDIVKGIKIGESNHIYFKGSWFILAYADSKTLIPFLNTENFD